MAFNPLKRLRELRNNIQHYASVKEAIEQSMPKPTRAVKDLSTDEFYDYLTNGPAPDINDEQFYTVLFDVLLAGYLDGTLTEQDLKKLLHLDNPMQLSRYVDSVLRKQKLGTSLLADLMTYAERSPEAEQLLSLLLPEAKPNTAEQKAAQIKDLAGLQQALEKTVHTVQNDKQALARARMYVAEKARQEERLKAQLAQAPELAQLLQPDHFDTDEQSIDHDAQIIYTEYEKTKHNTVIRQAPNVNEMTETAPTLSPAELIAYKQKILDKLRHEADQNKGSGDKNIRVSL